MANDALQAADLAQAMVDALKKKGDLIDPRIEAAFRAVLRHLFLPDVPLETAYADQAVPVKRDESGTIISSSSQPSMMVLMLNQLKLRPGDNVLEIGTGTGYNAAIMQHIVGDAGSVTSIELDHLLAQQAADNLQRAGVEAGRVKVVHGDGAMGYAPRAAYDRIIATVGVWDVPTQWVQQLKPQGIIVAPISLNGFQVSAAFHLQPDGTLYSEVNTPCGFVLLRGIDAGPASFRRVDSSSLMLVTEQIERIDSVALHTLLSDDHAQSLLGISLNSSEYWYGFLPYLMVHEPEGFVFALYAVEEGQKAYGMEYAGFALLTSTSACFVPYEGAGVAHYFGGADAFLAMQDLLTAWDVRGRPGIGQMRLRLIPIEQDAPPISAGKIYPRRHHHLHIWLNESP